MFFFGSSPVTQEQLEDIEDAAQSLLEILEVSRGWNDLMRARGGGRGEGREGRGGVLTFMHARSRMNIDREVGGG